jgi:hypothetical protein
MENFINPQSISKFKARREKATIKVKIERVSSSISD